MVCFSSECRLRRILATGLSGRVHRFLSDHVDNLSPRAFLIPLLCEAQIVFVFFVANMSTIPFSDYSPQRPSASSATQKSAHSSETTTPFNAVQSHAVLASATPFQNTPAIGKEGFTAVPPKFQTDYGLNTGTGAVTWQVTNTNSWTYPAFSTFYNSMGMSDTHDVATVTNPTLARKYEMDPDMGSSVYQDSTRARLQDTQLYINEENNFNIIATLSISTLIMAAIMLGSSGGSGGGAGN